MTQTQAPYKARYMPRDDVLAELLKVFTHEQLQLIAEKCLVVQAHGYGEVTLRFNSGHPRFIEWSEREELSKP